MTEKHCGRYEVDGEAIYLTDDAYDDGDTPYYLAPAIGQSGRYTVRWSIQPGWAEIDIDMRDTGDACDWDNPDSIDLSRSGLTDKEQAKLDEWIAADLAKAA